MNVDIFTLAVSLGIASFLLGLLEMIGVQLFWNHFYRLGLRIYSGSVLLPRPTDKILIDRLYKSDEGKYLFNSRNECLFISRPHFFNFLRIHTPFPFKGTVVWTDKEASITGRLPLGTSLFMLFWLIGWSAGSFHAAGISFFLSGVLFVGIMIAVSLLIEKRRMLRMIDELKTILNER